MPPLLRLVLDTNILLRGLINARSASGRIVDACDRRRVLMLLSKPLLVEYRGVLTDTAIVERYPELTTRKVEIVLRRLQYVGEVLRAVKARFDYPRDPKDSKVIELAIAGDRPTSSAPTRIFSRSRRAGATRPDGFDNGCPPPRCWARTTFLIASGKCSGPVPK